jgi:uncharacterized delta-60 repeat protein
MGDYGLALGAFDDGSSVVSGHIMGTATFGPGEAGETTVFTQGSDLGDAFVARFAPDGTLDWVRGFGGPQGDSALAVASMPDGSATVAGYFRDAMVLGEGEPNETELFGSPEDKDVFVARFAPEGELEWAVSAGGEGMDEVRGIAALADGSVAVTGQFGGSAIFGPGEPNETVLTSGAEALGTNAFFARYNADGTLAWARAAGSLSEGVGNDVDAAPDGSLLVVGSFRHATTFGYGELNETTLEAAGIGDVFLARLTPDGNLDWVVGAGSPSRDTARGVAARSDGRVVVTGRHGDGAVFGAGESNETVLAAANYGDLFVACFESHGPLSWVRRATAYNSDSDADIGRAVAALEDDGVLVTGWFAGSAEFEGGTAPDATLSATLGQDAFVARYDAEGALVWARQIGGVGLENRGYGVAPAPDDTLLVAGWFWDTLVFAEPEGADETSLISVGGNDIFLARYLR